MHPADESCFAETWSMRIRLLQKPANRQAVDPLQALAARLPDATAADLATIGEVADYTMTSPERLYALCDAVRHVTCHRVPGALVECGVWRGGSTMAMAMTLKRLGERNRQLWLYDTFDGMPEPGVVDIDHTGCFAGTLLSRQDKQDEHSIWCRSPEQDVRQNLESTGYPVANMHFVSGKVEDTIPGRVPDQISLLRLDTDWYESTRHELVHLYPRLSPGGILIIDDYGHWQGCRRAVDEYLADLPQPVFLNRIDYTGRLAVKPFRSHPRSHPDSPPLRMAG